MIWETRLQVKIQTIEFKIPTILYPLPQKNHNRPDLLQLNETLILFLYQEFNLYCRKNIADTKKKFMAEVNYKKIKTVKYKFDNKSFYFLELIKASKDGDVDLVQQLLKDGASVSEEGKQYKQNVLCRLYCLKLVKM